jgi:hypothetical protein
MVLTCYIQNGKKNSINKKIQRSHGSSLVVYNMKKIFKRYIYSKESWVHLSYPWTRCSFVIQNMKNYSKGVRGGSTLISHLVLSNSHDYHLVVFNNVQQLVSPNNARQTNGLTLLPLGLFFKGGVGFLIISLFLFEPY